MGAPPAAPYARGVLRTLLRPWTTVSTWWSLVLLVTGLVCGYVFTVTIAVGAAVTVSMVVLFPVAVALAWLLLLVAHGMARLERSRYAAYLGVQLHDPTTELGEGGWWSHLLQRLRSPGRWRELLYLLLRLPVSAVLVGLTLVSWAGSLALVTLPAYVGRLPQDRVSFGAFDVGDDASKWVVCLVGVVALVQLAPWVTTSLAAADLSFARSLLAHGQPTEIERKVAGLESSRVAAVDSAEAERRRIERDLHDGAQQRLIAAAMDLGVARERLPHDPDGGLALVAGAHEEVKAALRELRDLVRGIHPVILEDRGLDAALSAVVARSPVPVHLAVHADPRPSPAVESAAYFIVSEALTNVTRHSGATAAWVQIDREQDRLRLVVTDDGQGGADPARGTGLAGLAERVSAIGGSMSLQSPQGGPTRIEVELPCAS